MGVQLEYVILEINVVRKERTTKLRSGKTSQLSAWTVSLPIKSITGKVSIKKERTKMKS